MLIQTSPLLVININSNISTNKRVNQATVEPKINFKTKLSFQYKSQKLTKGFLNYKRGQNFHRFLERHVKSAHYCIFFTRENH